MRWTRMAIGAVLAAGLLPFGSAPASHCEGPFYLVGRTVAYAPDGSPINPPSTVGTPVTGYRSPLCAAGGAHAPRQPDVLPGTNALLVAVPDWQPTRGTLTVGGANTNLGFALARVGMMDADPVWSSPWIRIDPDATLQPELIFVTVCRRLPSGNEHGHTGSFTTIGSS